MRSTVRRLPTTTEAPLAVQTSGFVSAVKRILSISEQELTSSGNDYTHVNK
jgi:hypothetical protein